MKALSDRDDGQVSLVDFDHLRQHGGVVDILPVRVTTTQDQLTEMQRIEKTGREIIVSANKMFDRA